MLCARSSSSDTRHTGTLPTSLSGPHGIHPLGDRSRPGDNGYSQFWVNTHATLANTQQGLQTCAACHGLQGQGTVLSVVAAQRTVRLMPMGTTITLTAGEQVNCGLCHANPYPQKTASTP